MFSPKITIDLSENQKADNENNTAIYGEPSTGIGNGVKITIKRSNEPPGSNFYRYTHTIYPGGTKTFKLKELLSENGKISITHNSGQDVISVSAYSWKDGGKVLLVEVVTIDYLGTSTCYYSKKDINSLTSLSEKKGYKPQLTPEELETQLDYLNCKHNNAVTLNLTKDNSEKLSQKHTKKSTSGDNTYCCTYHNPGGVNDLGNITVEEGKVSCTQHPESNQTHPSSAPFFKHSITDGGLRIAAIKYYPNSSGPRRRIEIPGLADFQKGSLTLYVFHCTGEAPILIYVKGGPQEVDKWFKKPNSSNGKDELWINVSHKLGIKPDELNGNIQCDQYKELVKELECKNHKDCPTSQKGPLQSPPVTGERDSDDTAGSTPTENTSSIHTDQPEATHISQGGDGSLPDGDAQPVVGPAAAIPIGYIISGIFGGSGAAGLAGWKLYNRYNGDPWVRQI